VLVRRSRDAPPCWVPRLLSLSGLADAHLGTAGGFPAGGGGGGGGGVRVVTTTARSACRRHAAGRRFTDATSVVPPGCRAASARLRRPECDCRTGVGHSSSLDRAPLTAAWRRPRGHLQPAFDDGRHESCLHANTSRFPPRRLSRRPGAFSGAPYLYGARARAGTHAREEGIPGRFRRDDAISFRQHRRWAFPRRSDHRVAALRTRSGAALARPTGSRVLANARHGFGR